MNYVEEARVPPRGQRIDIIHNLVEGSSFSKGGIETWINDYLAFATKDYRVLSTTKANACSTPKTLQGHPLKIVGHRRSRWRFWPEIVTLALAVFRHRKTISDEVQIHRLEMVPWVRLIRPKTKISLVIHTNNLAQARFRKDPRWVVFSPVFQLLEIIGLRAADKLLVYSAVDFERVRKLAAGAKLGRAWFNDHVFCTRDELGGDNFFVWVGRMEKVKNPFLAIDAFEKSAPNHPHSLLMVGSGSLYNKVHERVLRSPERNRIRLEKEMPPPELASLLQKSSFLLQTSHFEGSPRILLEALACGVGIIAHANNDPEDWRLTSAVHFNVSDYTPENYAKGMVEVSQRPINRAEIAQTVQAFSASSMTQNLENYLHGK